MAAEEPPLNVSCEDMSWMELAEGNLILALLIIWVLIPQC